MKQYRLMIFDTETSQNIFKKVGSLSTAITLLEDTISLLKSILSDWRISEYETCYFSDCLAQISDYGIKEVENA